MNNQIFYFFYNLAHQSAFFDKVIIFFADIFQYVVILSAGLSLLFYYKVLLRKSPPDRMLSAIRARWKEILLAPFSAALATIIAIILKYLIHTPRPFLALPDVQALFFETGYAFPSGHATFFSALAVALFFSHKKVGYLFMLFAVLISMARIIAGVHFPIDILGGFILGTATAYFVRFVLKLFSPKSL